MNHNISMQEFEQIMSMMKWLPATQRRSVAPVINKLKGELFPKGANYAKKYADKQGICLNKALETCFDEALGTPRKDI